VADERFDEETQSCGRRRRLEPSLCQPERRGRDAGRDPTITDEASSPASLVVSHGGIVDASAVGCRPDDDFAGWGPSCGYCEGVRFSFEGDRCVAAELLRVPGSVLESRPGT
jgi:hypothetical protein